MKQPWIPPRVRKARPGAANVEHIRRLIESENDTRAILRLLMPR
jgi:hypothetical protein